MIYAIQKSSYCRISLDSIHMEIGTNLHKSLSPIFKLLQILRVPFRLLWSKFQTYISGATENVIREILKLDIIKFIRLEFVFSRQIPPQTPGSRPPPTGNQTWNIGLIDARCKNITCFGEEVIIGFSDTGALSTHIEIKDNFVGKTNKTIGFLNGIQTESSGPKHLCTPIDTGGHGTHVVGSACGKNYGVAPNATWMMCCDCTVSECPESAMVLCGQWLSCPYDCNDTTINTVSKDCSRRPHIISNSWGDDTKTSNVVPYDFFYKIVQLWNKLGIMSVFAGGNLGPIRTTIDFPASYPITIAIGAVNKNVTLAYFSSNGPAISTSFISSETGSCLVPQCNDDETICSVFKPDLVAPGVDIYSSFNGSDTDYKIMSGTSMATPQVAGVLALMRCANQNVTWDYRKGYKTLTKTADTSMIDLMCTRQNNKDARLKLINDTCNKMLSGICGTYPNNMYGYGLVYAGKAVTAAKMRKS